MGRSKEAPYYLREKDGRAILDYRTREGGRDRVALGLPYRVVGSSPEERRAARQAAEDEWRRRTDGRVVEEDHRIKTMLTLGELYALYQDQWAPAASADANTRQRMQNAFIVRKAYGRHIADWASPEARRPDGSKRWLGDTRTPLQRICADEGPGDFLAWRLLSVVRKTMRKEKSNLVQFFVWAKASGYLASTPPVALPSGTGTKDPRLAKSGRGYHIPLTPLQAAQIVAVMPEWSSRAGRNGAGEGKFLVRPFFEFMRLTGLREITLERIEVPRNWRHGRKRLRLEDADDKAQYGRDLPLLPEAVELLEKYAPKSGHIFGHHDFRKHVKAAAKIVFRDDPELARRFGGYHFRHFVATFLANRAGTNLVGAQFVLGHIDLGTTSGYVHADANAAKALLESAQEEIREAADEAARWAAKRKAGS